MSVRVLTDVLRYSRSSLGARLVLIVLADCADEETRQAWPSVKLLKERAHLSETAVHEAIRRLTVLGELEVTQRPGHSSLYRVAEMRGADSAGVLIPHPPQNPHPTPPEIRTPPPPESAPRTVKEPSGNRQSSARARARRNRRLPETETLTDERRAFASQLGLTAKQIETEWAKFADHEFAAPRSDWTATWRNWCRSVRPEKPGVRPIADGRPQPPGPAETRQMLKRLFG